MYDPFQTSPQAPAPSFFVRDTFLASICHGLATFFLSDLISLKSESTGRPASSALSASRSLVVRPRDFTTSACSAVRSPAPRTATPPLEDDAPSAGSTSSWLSGSFTAAAASRPLSSAPTSSSSPGLYFPSAPASSAVSSPGSPGGASWFSSFSSPGSSYSWLCRSPPSSRSPSPSSPGSSAGSSVSSTGTSLNDTPFLEEGVFR
mmetsp:Transcript_21104/g.59378  ORF Transcript_21104/g.59378 Transcript_21104/m.59378 type:complete len:205 (+) Transcript_21104:461-1075(+)